MFSSFKGSKLRMMYKPCFNLMVLILVCLHAYLGRDVEMKGLLYLIIFGIHLFYLIGFRPYRCSSTNILAIFAVGHLIPITTLAYFKAGGLRHGLLVSENFKICIISITCFFLFTYAAIAAASIICRFKWPMNINVMRKTVIGYEHILTLMQ